MLLPRSCQSLQPSEQDRCPLGCPACLPMLILGSVLCPLARYQPERGGSHPVFPSTHPPPPKPDKGLSHCNSSVVSLLHPLMVLFSEVAFLQSVQTGNPHRGPHLVSFPGP